MWLCQHFNVWERCKVEDIWTAEPLGSSGKLWQLESADRQVIKKAAVGFMCSAKKSVELPAVWFSSLLSLHTNTGAIISEKSKLAPLGGELLYCLKRPNTQNSPHSTHSCLRHVWTFWTWYRWKQQQEKVGGSFLLFTHTCSKVVKLSSYPEKRPPPSWDMKIM